MRNPSNWQNVSLTRQRCHFNYFKYSSLVKSNPVGQNLDSWVCAVRLTGHTELGGDIVRAGNCVIASQSRLGIVTSLLGHVEDELNRIEVGLGNSKVEDAISR